MLVHHCTICEASLALSAGVCVLGMRSHTDDTLYQMLCFNNEMLGVGPSGTLIKDRQKSKRKLKFLKSNSSGCRRSNSSGCRRSNSSGCRRSNSSGCRRSNSSGCRRSNSSGCRRSNSSGCRRSNNYIVYNKLLSNLQCYLWSDEYQKFKKKQKKTKT